MELSEPLNLEAKQGDTYPLTAVFRDSLDVPYDVTGYTVEFSLAAGAGSLPAFTYTQANYITVGTTNGLFTVEIPAAVTALWVRSRYQYEFSVTSPTGFKTTLFEGRLSIRPENVSE